ncbi:MAG: tetratricopeptide repeat protein [Bacteroidales bacterium]|nr:tetratricopeptide repeat protein [Bacteroidales bacterium]
MASNNQKKVDTTVQDVDAAMSKTELWLEKNQKNILYVLIAIVLVVAAVWGWNLYNDKQNAAAENEIFSAQFLFEEGDYQQALEGFEAVVDNYGGTKAGNLARAYAGLCQMNLGNNDAAISFLEGYSGKDNVIAPAMLSALGDCYVNVDKNADAAKCFEKAAKAANNAEFTPLYLKKAGLAYEAAGDKENALKVYRNIRDNWFESAIGQTIDKYIVRVQ